MKPYLVGGYIRYAGGITRPARAIAILEDHEVMDIQTLVKVEEQLLRENNRAETIGTEWRVTSFQPYEPLPVTEPVVLPHLNECAVVLPPVGSPLLIEIAPGVLVRASRPSHAPTRDDYLRFDIEGNTDGWYVGRPRWTHP